jgi:hypothetical protein
MEAAGIKKAEKEAKEQAIIDSLTQQEKQSARLLIKNLSINFNSRDFENPSLQKFYSGL